MSDLRVTNWPIDRPIPYSRNARRVPPKAIDKVAASLQEFGFRQPIVVDAAGVIIVGHTRLLAAKQLGWREVPVHVAENLTPAQVKAYRLMDNRSHEETDWDLELLAPEIEELKGLDFDLRLTGFDPREIEEFLLDPEDDERANQVPELPQQATTVPGDLWHCGPHRVLCSDSTDAGRRSAPVCANEGRPGGHRPSLRRRLRSHVARGGRPRDSSAKRARWPTITA